MKTPLTIRSLFRVATFAERRAELFGPIQTQLFILATFLLPSGVNIAFRLGLPKPELLLQRVLLVAVAFTVLSSVYCLSCRFLGPPPPEQTRKQI